MPLAEKQTTKQKEEKRMGAEYSPPLIPAARIEALLQGTMDSSIQLTHVAPFTNCRPTQDDFQAIVTATRVVKVPRKTGDVVQ
jgi:hypothetical protein